MVLQGKSAANVVRVGWLLVALFMVVLTGSCRQPDPASGRAASVAPATPAWSDTIALDPALLDTRRSDSARMAQLVHLLCSPQMHGRGAGYVGLDLARDVIADYFTQLDLVPAFLHEKEMRPDDQPYAANTRPAMTQGLTIPVGVRAMVQQLAFYDAQGRRHDLVPGSPRDFTVQGFSGSGNVENAPVIFAGYGSISEAHGYDSYRDFDEADVAGHVVVVFRFEPMDRTGRSRWFDSDQSVQGRRTLPWSDAANLINKAQWAARRGAAGMIFVTPPSHEAEDAQLRSAAASDFGSPASIPVMELSGSAWQRLLAGAGVDAGEVARWQQQADEGTFTARPLEGLRVTLAADVQRDDAVIHNVAAVLPGRGELANQWIIVGAHYDHLGFGEVGSRRPNTHAIHPGADDNASGTAAMMIAASHLAGLYREQDATGRATDRRSICFVAFSGEERGLLGSRHMVSHREQLNFDLDAAVAMVNLDMVGRLRDNRLSIIASNSHPGWSQLVHRINEAHGFDLALPRILRGASDHASFNRVGIPAIMLHTGLHDEYHTPDDTPDTLNYEGGGRIIAYLMDLIHELATDTSPLEAESNVDAPVTAEQLVW